MRTEVKRSLLAWPIAASAFIMTMSSITSVSRPRTACRPERSVPPVYDTFVMNDGFGTLATRTELSARSDRGTRAMKLPERVAGVLGVGAATLRAPVRDQQQELAGLVLQPPRYVDATGQQRSSDLLGGDVLATVRIATNGTIAADQAIGARTLRSLRNKSRVRLITQANSVDRTRSPLAGPARLLAGPGRPEFWRPELAGLSAATPMIPSLLPMSNRALGKRMMLIRPQGAEDQESIAVDAPLVKTEQKQAVADRRSSAQRSPVGWPVTQRLEEQLQALSAMAMRDRSGTRDQLVSSSISTPTSPIVRWSDQVASRLTALQSLQRLGDPRAGALIDELSDLATDGARNAEQLSNRQQQIEWLRASYAIARRGAVWRSVWEVASSPETTWTVSDESTGAPESLEKAIAAVRIDLFETGDVTGWTRYLLLDEIEDAAGVDHLVDRTIVAQRFLSRLQWHALDPEHLRWLERDSIRQLSTSIRPWTRRVIDYAKLMSQIERQESETVDLVATDIADAVQTLRFAENPKAVAIADAISTHYRNANIRLAISQPMLQRMLPTMDPKSVPVRTRMFGSQIRGTSRIESDFQVELSPSPDSWSLQLKTLGNIRTQSTAINGSVAIRTSGNSTFVAATPIEVTTRGIEIGDSGVDVRGSMRRHGIRTDYDGWPLIGSLVRSIAASRYDSLKSSSSRIANKKIERQVGVEIDTELDQRVGHATEQLSEMVLGPLGKLKLDPKVMDMQTTDQRLLSRYRLAGDWQLAAFTARPRAPRSSLMSVQVHQSALNNTLEQLVPRNEPMLIRDVIRNGAELFGRTDAQVPDDIPENVTVQFARTRPITAVIEDGQLWLTLRVLRLTRGNRTALTRFIVRAAYKPEVNGIQAMLVRDGHLRISGPGMSMRERLPIRAIFNKILSSNRPVRLTLPQMMEHPATKNLAVSQLELRDGWIAMAISESDAPRIALSGR